jgi:hypothetical protein
MYERALLKPSTNFAAQCKASQDLTKRNNSKARDIEVI